MLKVYLAPPSHLSKAMFRVARALIRHAPADIEVVKQAEQADLQVLHVVGADAISYAEKLNSKYAVIQYCYKTAGEGDWDSLWQGAKVVWSYYPLPINKFYYAPLGIDQAFVSPHLAVEPSTRHIGVLSSGYVSGSTAEAIEEATVAGLRTGLSIVHLGPMPVGMPEGVITTLNGSMRWQNFNEISDSKLAGLYRSTRWVSGLRHVEGFELPVIEGLACGARPIVFDRPEMRHWYNGNAVFVPESEGEELIGHLTAVMSNEPTPVSVEERTEVTQRFDWEPIAKGFWECVL